MFDYTNKIINNWLNIYLYEFPHNSIVTWNKLIKKIMNVML